MNTISFGDAAPRNHAASARAVLRHLSHKDKTVTVAAGQSIYVKIQTEIFEPNETFADYQPAIFVVVLVDPVQGQAEIAGKRYFP